MNGLKCEYCNKDILIERLTDENFKLHQQIASLEEDLALMKFKLTKVKVFRGKVEGHLKKLDILSEGFAFDEFFDVSGIAEEGELIKSDRKIVDAVPGFCDTLNFEEAFQTQEQYLMEQIKAKDQEVQAHKEFIKQLKQSLEQILIEHVKTKSEQDKARKEIHKLRTQLNSFKFPNYK